VQGLDKFGFVLRNHSLIDIFSSYWARWCFFTLAVVLAFVQTACVRTNFFGKDKYLLGRQVVKGNKALVSSDLIPLLRQTPNRKILGFPTYAYVYVIARKSWDSVGVARKITAVADKYDEKIAAIINKPGSESVYDSLQIIKLEKKRDRVLERLNKRRVDGNWWMRVVGEKPVFYDSTLAKRSVEQLVGYHYQHGFFEVKVHFKLDTLGQRVKVIYYTDEGPRWKVKSVKFTSVDNNLQNIMNDHVKKTLVENNEYFDLLEQEAERDRIVKLFRESGYVSFSRNFIFVENDTADFANHLIDVTVRVANSKEGTHHNYKIGVIDFVLKDPNTDIIERDTIVFDGINFISPKKNYSWRILANKVNIRSGMYYHQPKIQETQAALSSIDVFRFVNILLDSLNMPIGQLRMKVTAEKLQKYQLSDEAGFQVSVGTPGPYATGNLKIRNILGSFSSLDLGGRYSEEGQFSIYNQSTAAYRAREVGANAAINIPRLLLLDRFSILYRTVNPKTKFQFNYTFTNRPEYARQLVRGALTYSINPTIHSAVEVSPLVITVGFTERINSSFAEVLKDYKTLQQSFYNSLVTSFTANYIFNNTNSFGPRKKSTYLRIGPEIGGLTGSLLSKRLGNNPDSLGKLKIFRFYRFNADIRVVRPFGKTTAIATKLNFGMARPIGVSTTLPWEKFFFAGGGYSNRAWAPRRLGPGSFNTGNNYESPGNILIETSIELRQKLIGFLEGALFVDAGNVWTSTKDYEKVGADFQIDRFYKEIAVGAGFGVRMDFSFLLLRIDFAAKVYDPAEVEGRRYVFGRSQKLLLNFGIGYPF
jgi:hypothetical protein